MTELLRSAVSHQLTLNRAHALARAGELDEAARLLDSLEPTVAALDLRARIHAQQGQLAEADKCWARVLVLAPEDKDAQAGRATVARIVGGGRARPLVNAGRAAVAAAVVGVVVVGGVAWIAGSGQPEPAASSSSDSRLQAEVHRAEGLEQRLAAQDAERKAAADARSQQLDAIAAKLAMPGVRVERRADDVRVVFDDGLFRSNAELTPTAKPLLTEIGHRLAAMKVGTTVVGHAVAVTGGRTSGGSTVAYARAQAAAGHLAAGGPLTRFTLATAEQSEGPFPDAARNRTVTLVITPS
jgi:tetratricopeptide (TPR) repeat protein